jgi:hypothetical protein
MVNAALFIAAMRARLAELNATDRNDRDISEMRALSELIGVIDDGDLILWECKGILLLENAVAAYRPKEAMPHGKERPANRTASSQLPCPKAMLRPGRAKAKTSTTH